ncbi:MAG: hypothetical protein HY906_25855 [Deltaproteobacteria bacterium]|nr:hypothetical protein [Deltaproteobacteria bacterium]
MRSPAVAVLLGLMVALGCKGTVQRATPPDGGAPDGIPGDGAVPDGGARDGTALPDGVTPADDGAPGADAGADGGSGTDDIPGGGTILFEEHFDDNDFASRGWYDGSSGTIDTAEHAPGSASSYRCDFAVGATGCTAGTPARHPVTPSDSVYLSFYVKFSSNWVGSGQPYHPHMLHFVSDADDQYVGFANTHLTTYTEVVWDGAAGTGKALLALQDTLNVDVNCILRNDDSFVGCNGNFGTYPFTESRSVCACNGLLGDVDGRDCFDTGGGLWYSARYWSSAGALTEATGARYKNDWHFVEAYFQMNSIQGGVGVPDGKIRWVQDGQTLISYDHVLMRTGARPTLKFAQHAIAPYIGDGSPVAQTFWLDELTVATARP